MMTQVKRTAKEIGEEIRRNEREFEDFLAVSKKEIRAREIEAKNEIHAIQKKTILELRNELRQNNIVPDHIRLAVVIDQFHEDIPIEDIIKYWNE